MASNKYFIFAATYNGDGTSSSEASGSTVTITIASPGVVTWNSHGLAANTIVYLSTTGALPTGLTAGTPYYVRNPAANTFELSATSGGASINTSGTQSGTHTCATQGAWNQQSILTGTSPVNGSLAAGDTVYIRSLQGGGLDTNIPVTLGGSITLGNANGTAGSPVTWILDNGTVWSGKNGTLTYTTSSGSYAITLRNYNRFIARTKGNWILEVTAGAPTSPFVTFGLGETRGLKVNQPSRTAGGSLQYGNCTFDGGAHYDLQFALNTLYTSAGTANLLNPIGSPTAQAKTILDNLEISIGATGYGSIFSGAGYFYTFELRGGRVYGTGATTGIFLQRPEAGVSNSYSIVGYGFQIPKALGTQYSRSYSDGGLRLFGMDGGPGALISTGWGEADCRNISYNYPYLNATLVDSVATPVTWRVQPLYSDWRNPVELALSKLYTSAAAAKTITLGLLTSTNFGAGVIDRNSVWMDVSYIDDASGTQKTETTRIDLPGTALDTSTASWSDTSWGSVSFDKKKLSLTTAYSIKQNTAVTVTFYTTVTAVSAAYDQIMVDPDPQLT